jgi:hypothetical protein
LGRFLRGGVGFAGICSLLLSMSLRSGDLDMVCLSTLLNEVATLMTQSHTFALGSLIYDIQEFFFSPSFGEI